VSHQYTWLTGALSDDSPFHESEILFEHFTCLEFSLLISLDEFLERPATGQKLRLAISISQAHEDFRALECPRNLSIRRSRSSTLRHRGRPDRQSAKHFAGNFMMRQFFLYFSLRLLAFALRKREKVCFRINHIARATQKPRLMCLANEPQAG
jgi:hypothetical protein